MLEEVAVPVSGAEAHGRAVGHGLEELGLAGYGDRLARGALENLGKDCGDRVFVRFGAAADSDEEAWPGRGSVDGGVEGAVRGDLRGQERSSVGGHDGCGFGVAWRVVLLYVELIM